MADHSGHIKSFLIPRYYSKEAMFKKIHVTRDFVRRFNRYEEPFFYHMALFEKQFKFPLERVHFFSYETDQAVYFFAHKESKIIQPIIFFTSQGIFNEFDYLEGFKKFQDSVNLFLFPRRMLLVGQEHYLKPIIKYMEKACLSYDHKEHKSIEFIVKKEQENILTEIAGDFLLEKGYSIASADAKDAAFITGKWKFADDGEIENTEQRINSLPSSSITYEGKMVGFELLDTVGCMCNQFVLEEQRAKGLGKAIELDLGRKCIRSGITAFKYVEPSNTKVVDWSLRTPYWTPSLNLDGSYKFVNYIQLTPKDELFP